MIAAVPTQGNEIVSHWGHTPEISLFRISDRKIEPLKTLSTDQGCACKSGLAQILHAEAVTHVLVGQIGQGAYNALQRFGMTVIRGVLGSTVEAVQKLADGHLADQPELCSHEDCHDTPAADLRLAR